MRNGIVASFLLFLLPLMAFGQNPVEKGLAAINRRDAVTYIGVLASDSLKGREAGKPGGLMAAEYLRSVFETLGIKPWRGKYFQPFDPSSGEIDWNKDRRMAYKGLEMRNVIGYITGKNTDEIVIVGAHYDHLGVKANSSNDSIYNGADDNASGVSAVLQIAKAFVASGEKPERTVVFALWDAEEIGLVGSFHFVSDHFTNIPIPRMTPQTIKGYINCDMIGRNKNDIDFSHVIYYHSTDKPILGEWMKDGIEKYKLNLKPEYRSTEDMQGGSDHMPFEMKGIPVVFYFTDLHPDYHQPTDHADKINYDKVVDITKIAFLNLWNMANLEF